MEGRRWRKSHQALEWNQIRLSAGEALSPSSALRPLPPSISHSAAPFVRGRLSPQLETPRPQPSPLRRREGGSVDVHVCRTDVEFELYSILLAEQTQGCFHFSSGSSRNVTPQSANRLMATTPIRGFAPPVLLLLFVCFMLFVCLFWALVNEKAKTLA